MATQTVDWRRAEFILTAVAFLGFLSLPIKILKLYGSAPAHPLFVHVPVVLIPTAVLGGLVCLAIPRHLERFGIALSLVAIVGMSSIFLTMQAGSALSDALHLQGQAAHLISEHSQAAKILAIDFTAFTATLILLFASQRIGGGRPTGLQIADRILADGRIYLLLRLGLLVFALVAAFFVWRVGDLGAQAVWLGRLPA